MKNVRLVEWNIRIVKWSVDHLGKPLEKVLRIAYWLFK